MRIPFVRRTHWKEQFWGGMYRRLVQKHGKFKTSQNSELSHSIQVIQNCLQNSVSLFSHLCCVSLECFIFLSFHPPQKSMYFCFRVISNAAFSMKTSVVHSPSPYHGSLHLILALEKLSPIFPLVLIPVNCHYTCTQWFIIITMVTSCELEGRESVSHSVPCNLSS